MTVAPVADISLAILVLRGQRVLLDTELAALYGVTTKRFSEQVRRNRERFPDDLMFQLTADESDSLRSKNATLKAGCGQHREYRPYAFAEHGAIQQLEARLDKLLTERGVTIAAILSPIRELMNPPPPKAAPSASLPI